MAEKTTNLTKLLFNDVQKRWMFGVEDGQTGKKSALFKDNLDDPTFMTFKIEFGDWGTSVLDRKITQNGTLNLGLVNNYDELPIGLLNCPELDSGDVNWTNESVQAFNNTKEYSAYKYLRSRNEDARARYLLYFVNGLFEIQKDYPYIFKKISGIQELEKMDPKAGQRLKQPAKITLECYEGLHLKIRTLLELYRKAAWDDVYQRWILPENMREFKMIIYIFERRTFQDSVQQIAKDNNVFVLKNSEINGNIPVKAFECCPCEIDISDSASWGGDYGNDFSNNEESSKMVIKVKNVKTYFRNGLLQDKIKNIMIYDLVNNFDRSEGFNLNDEGLDSGFYENLTVDGAKALFLNKDILLENEDAKNKDKSYIWGYSKGGYLDSNFIRAVKQGISRDYGKSFIDSDSTNAQIQRLKAQENDLVKTYTPFFPVIEDNFKVRGGWTFELQNAPSYNDNMSFWDNLGENILNVLTGARQLMLISGGSFIHLIRNCLIDSYYIEPNVYSPIDQYTNGLGKIKTKRSSVVKDSPARPTKKGYTKSIGEFSNAEDSISTIPTKGIKTPKNQFDLYVHKVGEFTFPVLEDGFEREEQSYAQLEDGREIYDQEFTQLEDGREIEEQSFSELDPARQIKPQRFKKIEKERKIKQQEFIDLEEARIPDKQKFTNLDKERELNDQQFMNLENERNIEEQQFTELEDKQHKDLELTDLQLIARIIPDFKYLTLDEIRNIPKQQYLELKDATKRSVPAFKADKSALLESIRNIEGTNIKLLELDKDNKDIEDKTIEMLKKTDALKNFKLEDSNRDMTPEVERLKKITLFTEEFVENSDDTKKAFVNTVLEMKNDLRDLTKDIVNMLPIEDNYILRKGEDDHKNINSVLMSQNDIDQINHNMKFLAINDNDVKKLSFQTLITLKDDINRAIERSEAIKGLTAITKNSIATHPNEEIIKNASKSVLEEPKEKKNEVIY